MKVAFSIWEDRISPLFDASQELIVVEMSDEKFFNWQYECFQTEVLIKRASRLCDLGVEVLICGAISEMFSAMIESYGIRLMPFIAGRAEDVMNAYINGTIHEPVFHMPGCRCRCKRRNSRKCRGKNLKERRET